MQRQEGTRASDLARRAILELAAIDKSDFEVVLARILKTDSEVLDVERVNCWQLLAQPRGIRCVSGYVRGCDALESGTVLSEADYPDYIQALIEDPVILAHDACTDPRTRAFTEPYLRPKGIASMMDVPVWVRGALWGVVCHEHVGPVRHWTEAERDFAVSIGHIVSMAVEARSCVDAERATRVSEFFVAVLSHDLRSPLGVIKMAADGLLRGHTGDPTAIAAARIQRSAVQMSRMVEQLLDFSQVRLGGALPTHRVSMDLCELCRRLVPDIAAGYPGRVIDLRMPAKAIGEWDPDRLAQVLTNMVINALEHGTPGGEVWLHVDTGPDSVTIEVGNPGGMPSALLPVIFEPLRRVEAGITRKSGLGLGLYIVREIVNAHAGTIVVDSRPDETAFRIRLPRRSEPEQ